MEKIRFGIGFVTGRSNVCKIINNYYRNMKEQLEKYNKNVELTIFILYDTAYQNCKEEEFYQILPEVYDNINIKYITPTDIQEEIKDIVIKEKLTKEEAEFFFGHGHARGRNTVMHYAKKYNIDYLLFWDDDEYPVAVAKENGKNIWIEQDNLLQHLEIMEKKQADVTIGYHCGYISPIPYIDFDEKFKEEDMEKLIEAISNEVVSWESIREKMKNNNGVTYANINIARGEGAYEIKGEENGKWVVGSTLCLNLKHKERIPAFYNPPEARGEDAFFSTLLGNSKVFKVPVYHFHDGFLKYTEIMEKIYPKSLRRINVKEQCIESRFLKAAIGWIKYKPLLLYVNNEKNYKEKVEKVREKLIETLPKLREVFGNDNFGILLDELNKYDKEVEKHFKEYKYTNEIWNKLKVTY